MGPPAALPGDFITAPPIGPHSRKTKVARVKMPVPVLTVTPIISPSPPAPHALTWSSHRYRVANGHFYESKQERVGH